MDKRICTVIVVLSRSAGCKISVDDMARVAGLSRFRLSHLFKSETGTSPTQYLRTQRMQKAGELLATTSLTLKQVAYMLGVRDQSHFVRDFKKFHGLTPTQFREREITESVDKTLVDSEHSAKVE